MAFLSVYLEEIRTGIFGNLCEEPMRRIMSWRRLGDVVRSVDDRLIAAASATIWRESRMSSTTVGGRKIPFNAPCCRCDRVQAKKRHCVR